MSTIVIRKIPVYEHKLLKEAFSQTLEESRIGSLKGKKILLKPNLLLRKTPELAVTTHPAVVRAVAESLKERGAEVHLGDSPGGINNLSSYQKILTTTGILDACKEYSIEPVFFDIYKKDVLVGGKLNAKLEVTNIRGEYDLIVNLPKFKTHGFMGITAAVKNLFGFVVGISKAQCHLRFTEKEVFADMLIDLAIYVNPALTFIDAVEAMDGRGPSAGRVFKAGFVAGGTNIFELDDLLGKIAGISEERMPTVKASRKLKLSKPEDIKVIGEKLCLEGFELPREFPSFLKSQLLPQARNWLTAKPRFNRAMCRKCNICLDNCPPRALKHSKNGYPILLNSKLCIRCYCCEELCPYGAVTLDYSWLLRVLGQNH